MALTESTTKRHEKNRGDTLKTYKDGADHVSAVGLADESGNHMGIPGSSLYVIKQTALEGASREGQRAFSWSNATFNYAAGDTILLVENTATARSLYIDQIWCHSDTTTRVTIHLTNEASLTHSGTSVTGVNLNRESSNTAEATATADEVNNVQGNVVFAGSIPSDTSTPMLVCSGLILDLNDIIAVDYEDDGGEALVTILGHYVDD